jgi:hypothetical protein
MASSELGDLKTPKFNGTLGEDLQLWAMRVESIMSAKGVLDVVLPDDTGAEGAQGSVADGGESDGEGGQAGRTDGNTAMQRIKAVANIVSSLGDRPLRAVVGVRGDPREMWKRFCMCDMLVRPQVQKSVFMRHWQTKGSRGEVIC